MVKLPIANLEDERLIYFFREVSVICCSDEFQKLYKEMSKHYRRSGIKDAKQTAFQDTLFTIYIEQVALKTMYSSLQ
jgi:hypothetical protein